MEKHEIISAIATLSATIEIMHNLGKREAIETITKKILSLVELL